MVFLQPPASVSTIQSTIILDTTTFANMATSHHPPNRLEYAPGTNKMTFFNRTTLDVNVTKPASPPQLPHGMVLKYDAQRNKMVIFNRSINDESASMIPENMHTSSGNCKRLEDDPATNRMIAPAPSTLDESRKVIRTLPRPAPQQSPPQETTPK